MFVIIAIMIIIVVICGKAHGYIFFARSDGNERR